MFLVIVFALGAAMLNARAALFQQQGIRLSLDAARSRDAIAIGRNFPTLLRQRRWLLGWGCDTGGFVCQAAALHRGSVPLVQALLTTQLLFTLVFVCTSRRIRPSRLAVFGSIAISAGLALLIAVKGAPIEGEVNRSEVLLGTLGAIVAVTALVLVSRVARNGALLSAVAAGISFAMSAVYIKLTTDDLLTVGIPGTARDWPGYALAIATVVGMLTMQAGFAGGPLTWSVAAMSITNPVVSYLMGILAFEVTIPTDAASLTGILCAGALVAGGIVALAHVPALVAQYRSGNPQATPAVDAPSRGYGDLGRGTTHA